MRLIAMSSHVRLKHKQETLNNYKKAVDLLFAQIYQQVNPEKALQDNLNGNHPLVIVIGSQKGLCGNFNNALLQETKKYLTTLQNPVIITVGKRAHDFMTNRLGILPFLYFDSFTANTYLYIAREIAQHILYTDKPYNTVDTISSFAKSFFTQIPRVTRLLPIDKNSLKTDTEIPEYSWEESPYKILNKLFQQYLLAHLEYVLYESLIAEQAARFLSMDSSTRNAQNVLDQTQLQYNKLRQAKITKELIELSSSLS